MLLDELVTNYIKNLSFFNESLKKECRVEIDGLDLYPLSRFIKTFSEKKGGRTLVVTPTRDSLLSLYKDLGDVLSMKVIKVGGDSKILYSDDEMTRDRIQSESDFINSTPSISLFTPRTFSTPFLSPMSLDGMYLYLKSGDDVDISSVINKLILSGYVKSPLSKENGTFSLHGDILDIFPFEGKEAYRIYTEWDKIESISSLDPVSQLKKEGRRELRLLLQDENEKEYVHIDKLLRDDDYVIFMGIERLHTSFLSLQNEAKAMFKEGYKSGKTLPLPEKYLFPFEDFMSKRIPSLFIYDVKNGKRCSLNITPSHSYFGNVSYYKDECKVRENDGWKNILLTKSEVQKNRVEAILKDENIIVDVKDISSGFTIDDISLSVVTDEELFGHKKRVSKTINETFSSPLDSFVSLKKGDYVVHVKYGIGKYEGIQRVKGKNERDYITIKYRNDEKLYVPIEQADLVQKYIGNGNDKVILDEMGSKTWQKKKEKARLDAKKMAEDLLRLYAERSVKKGFPFEKDNDWQLLFESSFPYNETPDQLRCIEDVKCDMESDRCMDRLICGDVGYGKTEIAFRATFKAVMSGKQVVFLSPTVILTEQHYNNFKERIENFPLHVALLTRYVTSSRVTKIKRELKSGKIDVVFATQKVLGKDISFYNLGLLVVDEEQRFGVSQKEKIKMMKSNIDCITLSATPIPRTLYMSLLKVRDMSLLTTAPKERVPIETEIAPYNKDKVISAIERELKRGGQVFYLHNRVQDMPYVVKELSSLLPGVIIEGANGQMEGEELEDVMHRFIYEGVQVLVSTTIIENGIDIPNVNTIIVDRADRMGLSELYQLRGRVGRSDKKAYCYLFYPDGAALNDNAIKRLKVLSENTELGSGFKVSMSDMEIRGAGNIVGKEQSGDVEEVGLDLYMKMLEEEIGKVTNSEENMEVLLRLDYSGYIPSEYINDNEIKFELYKKIATLRNEDELDSLRSEVEDRFGPVPSSFERLLLLGEIKAVCRKLKISRMEEKNGIVEAEFSRVSAINIEKLINLVTLSSGRVKVDNNKANILYIKVNSVSLEDKAAFILDNLRRLL